MIEIFLYNRVNMRQSGENKSLARSLCLCDMTLIQHVHRLEICDRRFLDEQSVWIFATSNSLFKLIYMWLFISQGTAEMLSHMHYWELHDTIHLFT